MDVYLVLGCSLTMGCVIMFFSYLTLTLLQCYYGNTQEDVQLSSSRHA